MIRIARPVLALALGLLFSAGAASASPVRGHGTEPTPASELRARLNTTLQEHIYLAGAATGAALAGRTYEFKAAAGALDANSQALAGMIGSVYGDDAGQAFLALWRRHIGFVVDYTTGVAKKNKPQQDKAVNDLIGYASEFAAFLSAANPNLPASVVTDLVKSHIVTLKSVIDAQAAHDEGKVYMALRDAAAHMQMIADPLADAIARQFPQKFAAR